MSSWKVHLFAGGMVGLASWFFVSDWFARFQLLSGCLTFSLLPDLDIKTSKIYSWSAIIYSLLNLAVLGLALGTVHNLVTLTNTFPLMQVQEILLSWTFISIGWLLLQFAVHHGHLHSIIGVSIMTVPAWLGSIEPLSILFFFAAGLSHLLLDSMTSENVLKLW